MENEFAGDAPSMTTDQPSSDAPSENGLAALAGSPAPSAPLPSRQPKRILIEFGDNRQHQTWDVLKETAADLIRAVYLKPGEYHVVSGVGLPVGDDEPMWERLAQGETVRIVRNPKHESKSYQPTAPVMSGS